MDILEKIDLFTIDERRNQADEKAEWMKGYETLLSKRSDHQAGRVDWDTATHLFNTGLTPEQATKRANSGAYKAKGAR